MIYLLLIIGFVLLIKGADFLVDGASSIAKKYGISPLIIGLTIVAFGTSAPELVVNIMSGVSGKTDLAISNILGSNISNILLILGVTAMVFPIAIKKSLIKYEIPLALISIVLLYLLLIDNIISIGDAIILSIIFGLFIFYTFWTAKKSKKKKKAEKEEDIEVMSSLKSILYVVFGLGALIYGGELIVSNAVEIATNFGMPTSLVGLTIVAIGTSLPELATSIMAALKKQSDMAIGGIVGSNIFNTLWILGATGMIVPLKGYEGIELDLYVNIVATFLLLIFALIPSKNTIGRFKGAIFIILYISYITYRIIGISN